MNEFIFAILNRRSNFVVRVIFKRLEIIQRGLQDSIGNLFLFQSLTDFAWKLFIEMEILLNE